MNFDERSETLQHLLSINVIISPGITEIRAITLRKKLSFPLRISSVNFSHLLNKSLVEIFIFCAVLKSSHELVT